MDEEVHAANLRHGFAVVPATAHGDELDEPTVPAHRSEVDDDYNFVASMIESVGSQFGTAGPATNLFGDMSVSVPLAWRQAQPNTAEEPTTPDK
jgi:hypothetical protein